MNKRQTILATALFTLLFAGMVLLLVTRPKGTPITLATVQTDGRIRFEIYGEIKQPGVYESTEGASVAEAVLLAGGFTQFADIENSRAAQPLRDGDKVIIPTMMPFSSTLTPFAVKSSDTRTNLNLAPMDELMSLPGIGEKKAQDIIDYRTENGPFTDIAQLLQIDGFGEKTVERFFDLVVIN